ncbi:MAG: response regulator transcription factor, partial [Rhodocyclaceae bacterium]|nr:response regulator transcription factor [Rhodocyclaceae bacterium]
NSHRLSHAMPACPARIFLIEDDPLVAQFASSTIAASPELRIVGHAQTLQQAIVSALNTQADLYLVDIGLPDGSGLDLIFALSQRWPDAEILVFTVFGDEAKVIAALQRGATGYLLKGCSSSELLQAIFDVLQGGTPISPTLARHLIKHFRLAPAPQDSLTPREIDVLREVAAGYTNVEIATRLNLSPQTVSTHIKNIYKKLNVSSRVQCVTLAQQSGLLSTYSPPGS